MKTILGILALISVSPSFAQRCGVVELHNIFSPQTHIVDINDSGAMVGILRVIPYGDSEAFLRVGAQVTMLPGLSDGRWESASAINNKGDIVGAVGNSEGVYAVMWRNGELFKLENGSGSAAFGVNDSGLIVGSASWGSSGASSAFQWKEGHFVKLNRKLNAYRSMATAVNNRGQVVGWRKGPDSPTQYRAFLFEGGTYIDLGDLGGGESMALDINDAGQVVGWSKARTRTHAFLWENGVMTDLGTLGGAGFNKDFNSYANAINANGDIAVSQLNVVYDNFSRLESRAFMWKNGTMMNLGTLDGISSAGKSSAAYGINVHGYVVGDVQWIRWDDNYIHSTTFRWKKPCP